MEHFKFYFDLKLIKNIYHLILKHKKRNEKPKPSPKLQS